MSPVRVALPAWVDDADEAVDAAWDALRGIEIVDRVFYAASTAGDFSAIWHGVNVAGVIAGRRSRADAVRIALALGADSLFVNQGVKRIFERERPLADPEDRPHHLRQPSTSSFPSGHASSAVVAASLLAPPGAPGWLVKTLAGVVATSRVHVRIHHASDIVAGAAVGWAFAQVAKRLV